MKVKLNMNWSKNLNKGPDGWFLDTVFLNFYRKEVKEINISGFSGIKDMYNFEKNLLEKISTDDRKYYTSSQNRINYSSFYGKDEEELEDTFLRIANEKELNYTIRKI